MAFRRPMVHRADIAEKMASREDDWTAELGFESDELDDDDKSSAEESEDDDDDDKAGVNFVEYLALQRSLKATTEKKTELHKALQQTRADLKRTRRQLDQSEQRNRMQRAIFEQAHAKKLLDKDNLIDNLKLSLEDLQAGAQQTEGLMKMVGQITDLTNEKKEYFEKAELLAADLQLAKEELSALESEHAERMEEKDAEIKDLQDQFDPVKAAKASGGAGPSALDNEEIEQLRKEAQELRSKLRDAEFQAKTGSAGVSSGDAAKFKSEIEALQRKNDELREDLRTAKSQAAKLQALSSSDADKDQRLTEELRQLQEELSQERTKLREAVRRADATAEELTTEKATHERLKTEFSDLKASLDAQKAALEASGDSQKSAQAQLQSLSSELAAEKSSHKAEKAAHADTRTALDTAKKQLAEVKDEIDRLKSDSDAQMRAERDKFADTLQNAKAAHASEIAELKQRAEDDMRDLKDRLGDVSKRVRPMAEAISFLAKNYKALSKEVRDLQGEIEPAVKQCKRDLLRTLADVDKQYKEMLRKYRKEMALRKKLHNQLVDLRGNIRVFGRVRPVISEDGKDASKVKIVVRTDQTDDQLIKVDRKGKTSTFELDHVFSPESKQEDVFEAAKDVIVSCIDGFNVCIFAYGQTGSGKTFTMDGPDANPGLNRRALQHLFDVIEDKKGDWSYEIEVSVLEIYNETIVDLLAEKRSKKGLEVRHGKEGPYVEGLSTHVVSNAEEVRQYFLQAQKLRATSSTDMNEHSSRSHALLIVFVTGTNLSTGVTTRGKLNLIDLAGSERVAKSGALDNAARFKEATNINKSLSCLGDVIHALGSKQKHVPYRNSKLTHLLQDSLGGSAKTIMVVQVAPVVKNVDESVNSLNFASRVRAVELGQAKKKTESAEVASLKKKLKELQSS
ncbi:hypothetical protein PTSG_09709 [Salpingoeca rosetta]|uniref:Kinesin-like protein n=1 Tax=Salpingoeca rosetta (strain ATCC 50818 / BSB-021) TaxID=946362 RepID=F2UNT8_SALR5|nr:uncharacterized protein PTSG_09709 [Salpingoeca rosetta]EGD79293.1 hypothetical protein PTSG_09709 [Salpingoeca rosetta]|eukprot:XP_004989064.1 hypothetical protein PTSG_09709 [Salpingoeca rosetta]